ncbi:hypothetical protein D3C81_1094740 [compost metagenome]
MFAVLFSATLIKSERERVRLVLLLPVKDLWVAVPVNSLPTAVHPVAMVLSTVSPVPPKMSLAFNTAESTLISELAILVMILSSTASSLVLSTVSVRSEGRSTLSKLPSTEITFAVRSVEPSVVTETVPRPLISSVTS